MKYWRIPEFCDSVMVGCVPVLRFIYLALCCVFNIKSKKNEYYNYRNCLALRRQMLTHTLHTYAFFQIKDELYRITMRGKMLLTSDNLLTWSLSIIWLCQPLCKWIFFEKNKWMGPIDGQSSWSSEPIGQPISKNNDIHSLKMLALGGRLDREEIALKMTNRMVLSDGQF